MVALKIAQIIAIAKADIEEVLANANVIAEECEGMHNNFTQFEQNDVVYNVVMHIEEDDS